MTDISTYSIEEKIRDNQILQKLYDREEEIEILKSAYNKACNGSFELILIKGVSGRGKTVLVNTALNPLIVQEGFFITGKFEQFNRDEPYIPFVQAFRNLIKQILTEPEDKIEKLRKKLKKVLGKNGSVITQIIPEIELIIGKQFKIEEQDPQKIKIKFKTVFTKFLQVFASKEYPMILFMDDLQWADTASLDLFKYIFEDLSRNHLLIIGAYREDYEHNEDLKNTLIEVEETEVNLQYISLSNLSLNSTKLLIEDSINKSIERLSQLSNVIYRKTLGNPFFIRQLLKFIYEEKLLKFNEEKLCYRWEPEDIEKLQIDDSVIDILIRKLIKLPEETLYILKIASCSGNFFDLKILSLVCEKSLSKIAIILKSLVKQGIILPRDNIEEFMEFDCNEVENEYLETLNISFQFMHDRVQQAAYSLIPEHEEKLIHYSIGRVLLENTVQNEIENKILNIMSHLNHGLNFIDEMEEKIKLSKYNLLAGKKAQASAAYDSALKYFKAGIKLLPENSWDEYYQLTYDLYFELSKCEYLCSSFQKSEQLFEIIIVNAKTDIEIAEVYELRISLYSCLGNYSDAVKVGIKALNHLGVKLPENPSKAYLFKEIISSKWVFRNKSMDDLLNLPESNNYRINKVLEVLTSLAAPANIINEDLFALINLKLANLSVKYGNTQFSSLGYAGYGIFAGSVLGDYQKGNEFEKVALKLAEKYNDSSTSCKVNFIIATFVSHWTQHGKISIEYMNNAMKYGFESGELNFVGYTVTSILEMKYYLGVQLNEIYEDCLSYEDFAKKMKFDIVLNLIDMFKEMIAVLKGITEHPYSFINVDFEKKMIENDRNEIMTYYLFEIQIYYLFGDYKSALSVAEKVQKNIESIMGYVFYAEQIFYYSLVITGVYDELPKEQKKKYLKILKRNQQKMKKWANNCQSNFLHKYLLICAEMERLKGRKQQAETLYDEAIKSACENGYIQNEAIANELAAKYYFSVGRDKIATVYINEAYDRYQSWGAEGKAKALHKQYENIIKEINIEDNIENTFAGFDTVEDDSSNKEKLDTIMKVFKSISEESDLEKVLIKFLETAIDSVGANKGYIFIEEDEQLFIEVFKESWKQSVKTANHIALEKCENIPKRIIRYAARTFETIILDDSMQYGIFSKDYYIINNRPGFIVCLPLLFQDIFVGILYLENNMTTEVFTPESIEILKVISYQMAYVKKMQYFLQKDTYKEGTDKEDIKKTIDLIDPLTERELEVLNFISSGMSNKEVAETLEVSSSTVKTHTLNIYGKLGVNRRVQAVIRGKELGILK